MYVRSMRGDPSGVGNVARLMTMVLSMPQFHIDVSPACPSPNFCVAGGTVSFFKLDARLS